MKNANVINLSVDDRVDEAIHKAMDIYLSKLKTGFIDIGLEAAFQMHLADIISRELDQKTFYKDERFIVKFEKNMPINGNNDYVDIVIEYQKQDEQRFYLIELKFKKISDSAPDLGVIQSYIDIYNLDCHRAITANVCGCYFIFMTDLNTYTKSAKKGTRQALPMHDRATITAHRSYTVSGNAAINATIKYPSGFTFNNNYNIEYEKWDINGKPYWHFILKI